MKLLVCVLVLSLTGCSFFLTKGPSGGNPPPTYPSCTNSMTYPIIDGVLAGLFLAAMAGAIAEDDPRSSSFDEDENSRAENITSAALFAAAFGVSAYVGYNRVSKCRGARESFAAAYPNGIPPPAGAYPYGAYPYPQQAYPQQPPQPQPYPGQQPQPYPGQAPQPYPGQAPQPYPGQQQPPQSPPATQPPPPATPTALGTEGDVCAASSECATGLTCTSNVCMRPPIKR